MDELLQITMTAGTKEVADRLATELVDRRLAACVQVGGPIASTYHWQGKVETSEEWVCTAKSARRQLASIERLLGEIHPYEVPELIATPIVGGSNAYLKWLEEELAPSGGASNQGTSEE